MEHNCLGHTFRRIEDSPDFWHVLCRAAILVFLAPPFLALAFLALALLAPSAYAAGSSWTTINPMNAARAYHTATPLPSGKVLVAGGYNGSSALASAELSGSPCTLALAQALAADPTTIVNCSFVAQPDIRSAAVFSIPLAGFPTNGNDYVVLSTGLTSDIPMPGTFASTNLGGGNVRGDTDYDVTILQIGLNVPAGMNCLSLDVRFLSEEYPIFVGTQYNDAFIAELDTSDWTTLGSNIIAPHNFAFDSSGHVISINTVLGLSAANGAGTAFDGLGLDSNGGATDVLRLRGPITPGAHNLFLTIFDQGDQIYDSAVFVDNLNFINVSGGCQPGVTNRRIFLPMISR